MRKIIIYCILMGFLLVFRGTYPILGAEPEVKGEIKPLSFAAEIRPLFRQFDVDSMRSWGIDLSDYGDVKRNAMQIYFRLSAKSMPCDQAWSDNDLNTFKHWIDSGMQP